jgi:phosphohistidine phosphatase
MKVYLVQHGEAKTEEEDPERPLSKKGVKDVQKVAAFLAGAGVKVARVPERKVDEVGGLKPLDDPRIWFERILKAEKDTVLVGHLPYMSRLASLLLKGDAERNAVNFKQGSVVCLENPGDGNFSVEWIVIPELIPG